MCNVLGHSCKINAICIPVLLLCPTVHLPPRTIKLCLQHPNINKKNATDPRGLPQRIRSGEYILGMQTEKYAPLPGGGGGEENISQCPVGKKYEKQVEKKGTPLKKAENRRKVKGQLKLKE